MRRRRRRRRGGVYTEALTEYDDDVIMIDVFGEMTIPAAWVIHDSNVWRRGGEFLLGYAEPIRASGGSLPTLEVESNGGNVSFPRCIPQLGGEGFTIEIFFSFFGLKSGGHGGGCVSFCQDGVALGIARGAPVISVVAPVIAVVIVVWVPVPAVSGW